MMELMCPLCGSSDAAEFFLEHAQIYYRCHNCLLTFLSVAMLPTVDQEKARYDTHNNNPDDAGYRQFQMRLIRHMLPLLDVGARGLDYGLSLMHI